MKQQNLSHSDIYVLPNGKMIYYNNNTYQSNLLRLLTQDDLTEINSSITNVQQSVSEVNFGTASLRFDKSATLNIPKSRYIIIFLYGYMQDGIGYPRPVYYVNNTIIHELGNSKNYKNMLVFLEHTNDSLECLGWNFNISSSTQTKIIYTFGLNEQVDSPNNYFYMNYLCFT